MKQVARDARERILWSGIEVFARRGYAGTSVEDVLAGTPFSKPTLYYHFKSKAGLFRAILEFAFDEGFRLMGEGIANAKDVEEKLIGVTMAWFRFVQTHPALTRLVFATIYAAPEELPADAVDMSKRRRNYEFFRNIVQEGLATGILDSAYTTDEVSQALYGVLGQQLRAYLYEPAGSLDLRRAKRVVKLFLEGARK